VKAVRNVQQSMVGKICENDLETRHSQLETSTGYQYRYTGLLMLFYRFFIHLYSPKYGRQH